MDAPPHPGAEVGFQHLQIFGGEARRRHEAHAQHVQRFLLELALDNVTDALQYRIQAPKKTALAGIDEIVEPASDLLDDRHTTAAGTAFSGKASGIAYAISHERHGVIHEASQHHFAHLAQSRRRAIRTQYLGYASRRMRVHAAGFAFVPEALHLRLPVLVEDARLESLFYGAPLVLEQRLRGSERGLQLWRVATRLPVILRQHVHRRRVAGEIHRLEMFQGCGVEGQIPWQQVNGREKQRVVCQVAPPESFRRFGLARRHNHFAGELAPPVVFGDTRRVPVELDEGPHLLQGFAAVVNGERLPRGTAGVPGNQRPPRKSVRDEILGPLPDLIFSSECRRVVFPIVRYLRGNKSPEPIDLDRLQLAPLVRRQVLGALERAQIFLEYPAVAPMVIFGALCRGACVLQRDGQCGIELLQHCKDAFEIKLIGRKIIRSVSLKYKKSFLYTCAEKLREYY